MLRVLMDADCLIKITRAGYKESAVRAFELVVPEPVVKEIVAQGSGHASSELIATNISARRIEVRAATGESGDSALTTVYRAGTFDCVGTDDRRLINRLTTLGIPCVVPGLLLYELAKLGQVSRHEAERLLQRLQPSISSDEYQIVRHLLKGLQ
ncbi:MAG: hypothetical protein OXC12_10220 [Spirochaetaceae bacterium]|nr:hypothetical protein [Spirochaetaceae bacterium]